MTRMALSVRFPSWEYKQADVQGQTPMPMAGFLASCPSFYNHDPEDDLLAPDDEKHLPDTAVSRLCRSTVLGSGPVITKIASWCRKHNHRRDGVKPTLAVIRFDTGSDSELFSHYKHIIAAKVGVGYLVYKLAPDVPLDDALSKISELNQDNAAHGILIQRPLLDHLCEHPVMDSVSPPKHIEEFTNGKPSNIALTSLTRILDHYGKAWMLKLNVILLGGLNIITPPFKAELKRRFQHVNCVDTLEQARNLLQSTQDTVLMTELNQGGVIKPEMLGPAVRLVVDMGFDGEMKIGDLDNDVLDMDELLVVPSPGGVLPAILWMMMERTIKARDQLEKTEQVCGVGCAVL